MPAEKMVCIFRTPNMGEIAIIKSLLDANEIPYFIENEHFASIRGPADGAINFGVMVQGSYADETKELLREIIEPKPTKESETLKAEVKIKYREKYRNLYLFLDVLGLLFGIACLTLALFMAKGIFSAKEISDTMLAILFCIMLSVLSIFILYSVIKDIKSLLKIKTKEP